MARLSQQLKISELRRRNSSSSMKQKQIGVLTIKQLVELWFVWRAWQYNHFWVILLCYSSELPTSISMATNICVIIQVTKQPVFW